jgi:hypothetical protein
MWRAVMVVRALDARAVMAGCGGCRPHSLVLSGGGVKLQCDAGTEIVLRGLFCSLHAAAGHIPEDGSSNALIRSNITAGFHLRPVRNVV